MSQKGIFIAGTDTGVGKTQVTYGVAAVLQRRFILDSEKFRQKLRPVRLWKPVQTGVKLGQPDADSYLLKLGSGISQDEADIATLTFPDPLAPWMAAKRIGTEIDYGELLGEGLARLRQGDCLVVEGAGGLAVPITKTKLMADLALELDLPLVIVARPGLGTVNHTLLSISFAKQSGMRVAGVILNGCRDENDPALQENVMMIEQFSGVPVIGKLPWFPYEPDKGRDWENWRNQWIHRIENHIDLERVLQA